MGDAADDVYDAMWRREMDRDGEEDDVTPPGWCWVCKAPECDQPCCEPPGSDCPFCELEPVPAPF